MFDEDLPAVTHADSAHAGCDFPRERHGALDYSTAPFAVVVVSVYPRRPNYALQRTGRGAYSLFGRFAFHTFGFSRPVAELGLLEALIYGLGLKTR